MVGGVVTVLAGRGATAPFALRFHCLRGYNETVPLPCGSTAFVANKTLPSWRKKTAPLPCGSTAFEGRWLNKTAPSPCISTAFVANKTLPSWRNKAAPLPCCSTAFVAKTLPSWLNKTAPLPHGPQVPARLRRCLCLVIPLPSWLRQRLCLRGYKKTAAVPRGLVLRCRAGPAAGFGRQPQRHDRARLPVPDHPRLLLPRPGRGPRDQRDDATAV